MGSTNKTANLELSQFLATDSPKWLTDYNADMEKIDVGYSGVKTQADATDLAVNGLTSTVTTLGESVSDQSTAIANLRTDVTGNTGSINTINSLIGNGEPTTTDKTLIGAINELNAEMPAPVTSLPAANITYNNTNSGLTATNAQAAIDELADKIDPDSVSVTADGVKTLAQLATSLANLIDFSKITLNSILVQTHGNEITYRHVDGYTNNSISFSYHKLYGSGDIVLFFLNLSTSTSEARSSTIHTNADVTVDSTRGAYVPTSGDVFTFYY